MGQEATSRRHPHRHASATQVYPSKHHHDQEPAGDSVAVSSKQDRNEFYSAAIAAKGDKYLNAELDKARMLRNILPRIGALITATPKQLQAVTGDLGIDAGERIRNAAHLAPRPGSGTQSARSNKKIVAAVITNLDRFAERIAHLHAKDGAVANMGSFEAIPYSIAVCSRNNT